jgi:4a-hydroxytetrahydrobiopterin dehydratase
MTNAGPLSINECALGSESMSELANQECVPCRGGAAPLEPERIADILAQLQGWSVEQDHHLSKTYSFPDFAQALAFTNHVGAIAEQQVHHPDIFLTWGQVRIEIWTHKIDGLTESDFILAAKIDALQKSLKK